MKHLEQAVEWLNERGNLGVSFLQMKLKVSHAQALKILREIVKENKNVHFVLPTQIAIKGRELKIEFSKRKSKYKNIIKQ